jgi:hypothetical protein
MIFFYFLWVRIGDFRDGVLPPKVLKAVPSSLFSDPAELDFLLKK